MARRRTLSPVQGALPTRRSQAKESESDHELVNTESQQMLALGALLRKPKTDDKEVQQFRARVASDRKQLKVLFDQRVRQAEEGEKRRRNEVASTILNALKTPNRPVQGELPTFDGTTIAENAAYVPVANVLAASEGLIAEYERLENMVMNMQDDQAGPIAENWIKDLQEAEMQFKMGARVALRNVKKVLGADVEGDKAGTTEQRGEEIVEDDEGEIELNYELQKGLRYAERGVKRMVKGLPIDE